MRQHPYRLQAAFFHHGTQGAGHYWVYIYDFKQEVWRKYNDSYVSIVTDRNEIFGRPDEQAYKSYAGPANPYLLIYVKDDEVSKLVESVHREIVYPPPPDPPPANAGISHGDVEMADRGVAMMNGGEHAASHQTLPSHGTANPAYAAIFRPAPKRTVGTWDDGEAGKQNW